MASPAPTLKDPPRTASEEAVDAPSPPSLSHPLAGRFAALAEICHRFSTEIAREVSLPFPAGLQESVRENVSIARTIFGKWSLDILVITYLNEAVGFQELKYSLGTISSAVLSRKLRHMEEIGLVRREVIEERPPRTQYSLTPMGLMVARLGEPVFLYLRLHGPAAPQASPFAPVSP